MSIRLSLFAIISASRIYIFNIKLLFILVALSCAMNIPCGNTLCAQTVFKAIKLNSIISNRFSARAVSVDTMTNMTYVANSPSDNIHHFSSR